MTKFTEDELVALLHALHDGRCTVDHAVEVMLYGLNAEDLAAFKRDVLQPVGAEHGDA